MANPNLVSASGIYGKVAGAALTDTSADIITNSSGSGKIFKVNAIYCANVDGTDAAPVTVGVYDSSATATYYLASTITVPADTTVDLLSKSIYLEEGDKIVANSSASDLITILVSYEEIS